MLFNKKQISAKNSIEYIAKFLIDVSSPGKKIIGITSSSKYSDCKDILCTQVCGAINNFKKSVILVSFEKEGLNKESKIDILKFNPEILDNDFKSKVFDLKLKYDLVILNIPSVIFNAKSIDYLKICDKIFSAESCMYTYYSDFEKYLQRLNLNNIELNGIITFS